MAVLSKRLAAVDQARCVACGCCLKVCPRKALRIVSGCFAAVDPSACVGCGKCEKECPACIITLHPRTVCDGGAL